MAGVLTISDAVAIGNIVAMASGCQKVARCVGDGDVVFGHARHFVGDGDVREMTLRVTLQSGLEAFWPVAELIGENKSGLFAQYDWS